MFGRAGFLVVVLLAMSFANPLATPPAPAAAQAFGGRILAPAGRQAAWLDLEAPRPRPVTQLDAPAYVTDVSAVSGASTAVLAVSSPFGGQGSTGTDLFALDLPAGVLSPLVQRTNASESLGAPAWWADGSRLLFQNEDHGVVGIGYLGVSTVIYPTRIESVQPDGSGRKLLVNDARQPAPAPDGTGFAFLRTSTEGTALIMRTYPEPSEKILIPAGAFRDITSPRYAPQGDRIAFMAPGTFVGQASPNLLIGLLGAGIALAHGFPWDLWVVSADGSGVRRLAQLGGDDATVAWSPDGGRLFVYGGTGSFLVDASSGEVTALPYVAGYGGVAWIAES
jgi:Tol biopolymer transport system component